MAFDGNSISCDHYGCRTQDTSEGDLSPEDIRVRYHMLGWRYSEADGQGTHHCPIHL
jgi:hypothetical protein